MIGLLENLVGADPRGLHRGIALVVQRGGVDIDPADVAVVHADGVDLTDAVGDELRAVAGMLAEDEDQPLVADAQQGLDLAAEFVRAERAADFLAVGAAERAVTQSLVHSLPT